MDTKTLTYAQESFNSAFGEQDGLSYHYDTEMEQWELIWDDTDKRGKFSLSVEELQILNLRGFVYMGEQMDVDYEDGSESKMMDITYFKYVDII